MCSSAAASLHHRPAQRRATHAAKPARVQETDRRRVSAVLTAYAELERLLLLESESRPISQAKPTSEPTPVVSID